MGLSAFGRAMAASAYGTSRLLYVAEHSPPAPAPVVNTIVSYTRGVVDWAQAPGERRRFPGLAYDMATSQPAAGGFGLLPYREHTQARHAWWAARLLSCAAGMGGARRQWWARVCSLHAAAAAGPGGLLCLLAVAGRQHGLAPWGDPSR